MNKDIVIKLIELTDFPIAAEVIRGGFATVAAEFGLTEQNCPNHTSFITPEKLQNHFDWGWLMHGLYDDMRFVGYVSLSNEGSGVFELHNLAVLPEYRHKGHGKRLLDFCKAKTVDMGGTKITLSFIEENIKIKNWYAANGFVYTGKKIFVHLPFTAGYMEWSVE